MNQSSRERLLQQFRELATERLKKISQSLMVLEGVAGPEQGKAALRELHSLKGEARMMGFADINSLVHEMEGAVRAAESKGYALTSATADALLVTADALLVLAGVQAGAAPDVPKLTQWLKQRAGAEGGQQGSITQPAQGGQQGSITQPAQGGQQGSITQPAQGGQQGSITQPAQGGSPATTPPPAPATTPAPTSASAPAPQERAEGSVRIGAASLDLLTQSITNLGQMTRRRELQAEPRLKLVRELALLSRAVEDLGPKGAELGARLLRAKDVAAELHRAERLLTNEELKDLGRMSEEIQALRMVPLARLFESYPRMVRELGKDLSKEIDLRIEGENTRADRAVIEALQEPLLHLVRNALDHGLETSHARHAAGKQPKGVLTLRASREGERIALSVQDDGRGIDPQALRRSAVSKGLMDEARAGALSDAQAIDLIFLSGFSTKDQVTDLSGRGVGLDVVRSRLQELGGEVTLASAPGAGTTFELRVPVSLTVAPLLFLEVGDERLCITATHVTRALQVEANHVRELAGRPALQVDEALHPYASIHALLGFAPERPPTDGELVLLLQGQGASAAISVDRVLEERVQAILPLKGMLSRFPHLSGATPLADGRLAMVLSAAHLVMTARGGATASVPRHVARVAEPRKRRILVVDDSPLTRELLASLLEAVGYEIVSATDGQEAFDRLGRETVDMVVTDLEMPRMDGLELTRRLKGHSTLRGLPVVIVTTRGSESDRRRGMEAGADGYIAKGDLVRQDLVDVVGRLLA